jgi:tetratricopeptide (TPR) repeat protein
MPITTDKELPENIRAIWLRAYSAFELRNYGYTISLLQAVLKDAPAFLDGRKMLRRAEVANSKGKKGAFLSGLSTASLKGAGMVKKDPKSAMELAEKTLENDPFNRGANDLLKDAARALNYPEIAAFALETLVEGNPKDTKLMHELGAQYSGMGSADKAVTIYGKILEVNPADLVAVKLSKDAAANATMKQGGWETAGSYRDLIKNKDQAELLEQKNRVVKDIGMIENTLAELSEQYQLQPDSLDLVRRIAMLYEEKQVITGTLEDLQETVQWFAYANDLAKGGDPAIARKLSDFALKRDDLEIKGIEDWFAQDGEQHVTPEEAEQYRARLNELKGARKDTLINDARKRVERNPTDLQLRFELGERLLEAGMFEEAIPELQRARQNPNARLRAMSHLGRCFVHKKMYDMAANQFESAASEMVAMDNHKKDTLYELGSLYEKMSQREKYIKCMKDIAEVDYTYRDVAQRIERFYSGEETAT